MLGIGGGASGSGFASPTSINLPSSVSQSQADTAYQQSQAALQQQQAFMQALQGQNGIQNQSNVFNQLQGVANGTGPNPAQAMLAQATGANVANQASLMAGQRGAGQNVGLMSRQAAQQGAQTQQQAANQAATMQAQQSLGALGQLSGIAGQQVGQQAAATSTNTQAQQNQQQQLLNAIASNQATRAGLQANVNTANAGLAQTQMQGQQGMLGGLLNAAGGIGAAALLAAEGGKVDDLPRYYTGTDSPIQSDKYANPFTQLSPTPAATTTTPGTPPSPVPMEQSKPFESYKDNTAQPNFGNPGANALYKGASSFGKFLAGKAAKKDDSSSSDNAPIPGDAGPNPYNQPGLMAPDVQQSFKDYNSNQANQDTSSEDGMAKGGKVPAMVSPGEQYLPPKDVEKVKQGKNPMSVGERIPGKPKVKGAKDSYANDTVSKNLDEGGIVIPRSVTQGPNPHWESMKFVRATLAKAKHGKK